MLNHTHALRKMHMTLFCKVPTIDVQHLFVQYLFILENEVRPF
jgi:hypothetical protein